MERVNLFLLLSLIIFISSIVILLESYNSLVEFGKFTGSAVSSEGIVNITIEELVLVDFIVDSIDWGAGYVFENASYSAIDTFGNVTNGTWDPVGSGFVIKNIGNLNATLNFSAGKNAESFIGGTTPSYQYRISNIESEACIPPGGFNLEEFYEIPLVGTSTQICETFSVGKSIAFDLSLVIPINSLIGNLSDEISISFEQA
jgi:hypothetical protein